MKFPSLHITIAYFTVVTTTFQPTINTTMVNPNKEAEDALFEEFKALQEENG
jgi:hypothetical protein